MPTSTDVRLCRNGLHEMTPVNIRIKANGGGTCRECVRAADRARNVRDQQKRAAARRRRWHGLPDEKKRALALARRGITPAEYDAMLVAQRGVCAICSTGEPGGKHGTHFAVDHDHETGAIRGLLCGHCNVMLGNAKDDPARLRAAASYLERER